MNPMEADSNSAADADAAVNTFYNEPRIAPSSPARAGGVPAASAAATAVRVGLAQAGPPRQADALVVDGMLRNLIGVAGDTRVQCLDVTSVDGCAVQLHDRSANVPRDAIIRAAWTAQAVPLVSIQVPRAPFIPYDLSTPSTARHTVAALERAADVAADNETELLILRNNLQRIREHVEAVTRRIAPTPDVDAAARAECEVAIAAVNTLLRQREREPFVPIPTEALPDTASVRQLVEAARATRAAIEAALPLVQRNILRRQLQVCVDVTSSEPITVKELLCTEHVDVDAFIRALPELSTPRRYLAFVPHGLFALPDIAAVPHVLEQLFTLQINLYANDIDPRNGEPIGNPARQDEMQNLHATLLRIAAAVNDTVASSRPDISVLPAAIAAARACGRVLTTHGVVAAAPAGGVSDVRAWRAQHPRCGHIVLSSSVTDADLCALAAHPCPVVEVDASRAELVTYRGLHALAPTCVRICMPVGGVDITDDVLAPFASANLTALTMEGPTVRVTSAGLQKLVQLQSLRIKDADASGLRMPTLPQLRQLHLINCQLANADIDALLPFQGQLVDLSISGNASVGVGITRRIHPVVSLLTVPIAAVPRNPLMLQRLDISGCNVGGSLAAIALLLPATLTHLSVRSNALTAADATALADRLPALRRIVSLDVGHNPLTPEGVTAIANALSAQVPADAGAQAAAGVVQEPLTPLLQLAHLIMDGVCAAGARDVAPAWRSLLQRLKYVPHLQTLDLAGNGIPAVAEAIISDGLAVCVRMKRLNLSRNAIGAEAVHAIAAAVRGMPDLVELQMDECGMDDAAAQALIAALPRTLRVLSMARNELQLPVIDALREYLSAPCCLTQLDLTCDDAVTTEAMTAFAECISANARGLTSLTFRGTRLNHAALAPLIAALPSLSQLQQLELGDACEEATALALLPWLPHLPRLDNVIIRGATLPAPGGWTDAVIAALSDRAAAVAAAAATTLVRFIVIEAVPNGGMLGDGYLHESLNVARTSRIHEFDVVKARQAAFGVLKDWQWSVKRALPNMSAIPAAVRVGALQASHSNHAYLRQLASVHATGARVHVQHEPAQAPAFARAAAGAAWVLGELLPRVAIAALR